MNIYTLELLEDTNAIFWFRDKHSFLSNFYLVPVVYQQKEFPSAENAYQYAKSNNPVLLDKFLNCSPSEAKRLGSKLWLSDDWEDRKVLVMTDILQSKFLNTDLQLKLLDTGNRLLIEGNDWNDRFWGCSYDPLKQVFVGDNVLGSTLMNIRASFRGSVAE